MDGKERRNEIKKKLMSGSSPLSGSALANEFGVSRQIIVGDIALLRAEGLDITSTSKGYLLQSATSCQRVFKVKHTPEETKDELFLIVDFGGTVKDVFIYHKLYNIVRAEINITSRRDAEEFLDKINSGESNLLLNLTSGYHYHTVYARSKNILDLIQLKLQEGGYLAKLQDYEPIDFNNQD